MLFNWSSTATILFVNVPLGSNGDTHQSIKSPVFKLQIDPLFITNIYRKDVCNGNILLQTEYMM